MVIEKIKRFMTLEGFDVEIRSVAKDAYRCYLKFPELLYEQGLSPLQDEKILILMFFTESCFRVSFKSKTGAFLASIIFASSFH